MLISIHAKTELQPIRLLCPWDSPGKNTEVGCHFLLDGIFLTQELNPGLPIAGRRFINWATQEAPDKNQYTFTIKTNYE